MRPSLADAHLQLMRATTFAALNAITERETEALAASQETAQEELHALAQALDVGPAAPVADDGAESGGEGASPPIVAKWRSNTKSH